MSEVQFLVKRVNGKSFILNIEINSSNHESDTKSLIKEIRAKVSDETGIQLDHLRVLLEGKYPIIESDSNRACFEIENLLFNTHLPKKNDNNNEEERPQTNNNAGMLTLQVSGVLNGGRLHGQILQKSLLYFRPRGFAGMKSEKVHCLMMSKLVNTKQIHLLTLVKYFYARMAIFHFHPASSPASQFARLRSAESQKKPFLYPRH